METLQRLQFADLAHLAPELTLVIAAIFFSLLDLMMPNRSNRNVIGWLSLVAIVISALFVIQDIRMLNPIDEATQLNTSIKPIELLGQSYVIDDFANLFKLLLLAGTGLIILMSMGRVKDEEIQHKGEFYYLFLPALVGAMMMASSGDLITLFIGLELLSITSYVMVGIRKKHLGANEGAFKYAVQGGIASAIVLYGMSFLYGISGSTNISEINQALSGSYEDYKAIIYLAAFLLIAGFGFKIAAAPFHTWAPDVYEGSASPVTAFLAVVSKAAALALTFRIMYSVFALGPFLQSDIHKDIFLGLSVVAGVAMIVGNAVALRQRSMKRLLAYSGIANAGYLLVPISTQYGIVHYSNFTEFLFYLIAYLFMNIGIIAVYMMVSESTQNEEISAFAGLYYRAPLTAVAAVILILSLAGLPVTGGFFGKLYILLGTLQVHKYWLAAVLIGTSVVSFYYYFGIIRQMFMRSTYAESEFRSTVPAQIAVWICVAATVAMGLIPHVVIAWIEKLVSLQNDFFIR